MCDDYLAAKAALELLRQRFEVEPLRVRPLMSEIVEAERLVKWYEQQKTPKYGPSRRFRRSGSEGPE